MKPFEFKITTRDKHCGARTGIASTTHGDFRTPVFMPVGTQGTVKAVPPRDLEDAGAEIILSNAYHLFIRPGTEILREFGGLHRFMGWQKPILTDSGGFQVFSLNKLREITEDGVRFNSHFDGAEIKLTPEKVIEIQEAIGSDIAMIFDECPPMLREKDKMRESLERTLRWSERAKRAHRLADQALFGIVQGGVFLDLRKESLERTVAIGFDGYALGGLCVGEEKEETFAVFRDTVPRLPEGKPRYMMGIGMPADFFEAVENGADMFDCVTPTRYGRNGTGFSRQGLVVVRNGKYQRDQAPLDPGCDCYVCRHFSRGYLRHLLNMNEMLGPQLISLHNIAFMTRLFRDIRAAISAGTFLGFKKDFLDHFDPDGR
ncbi:MAG: tRNA guanosine(34) transglycosylase Tgt [Candidatus Omnitrophota bacterium]